jgi:hypothetical protein
LAALAGVLGLRFRSDGRFKRCLGNDGMLTNSREHFPSMPERYADVLEVLIAQMAEYGNIDLILGKALGVLPETELFEPVRNLLPGCCASAARGQATAAPPRRVMNSRRCTGSLRTRRKQSLSLCDRAASEKWHPTGLGRRSGRMSPRVKSVVLSVLPVLPLVPRNQTYRCVDARKSKTRFTH